MVARLLAVCGVFLGSETDLLPAAADNKEGFWEHREFLRLDEAILQALGGAWDRPPAVEPGWETRPELLPLAAEASDLVRSFAGRDPWGWKDPRAALTLPFWTRLLPGLKVVVCVRNPLDVARSLARRGYTSHLFGLDLWLDYRRLAACRGTARSSPLREIDRSRSRRSTRPRCRSSSRPAISGRTPSPAYPRSRSTQSRSSTR